MHLPGPASVGLALTVYRIIAKGAPRGGRGIAAGAEAPGPRGMGGELMSSARNGYRTAPPLSWASGTFVENHSRRMFPT